MTTHDDDPAVASPELVRELAAIVGAQHVLVDAEVTESYRTDWTGRFRADSAVVVRPADTAEVAEVVRTCAAHQAAVCPQGGNTGLVGGSVPLGGEIVVSTRRLQRLDPVDERAGTVVAGAGVTIGDLRRHAREAGFEYAVDLAPRDSATLGGTIATNAGGVHVIRYGATRDQLLGIETVLADGSVVGHLTGLRKDNTGYHLPGLLCGSEGTLGIITAATVRLHRELAERVTALVAFDTPEHAAAAVGELARVHLPVEAVELMLAPGFELVRSTFGLPAPFDVDADGEDAGAYLVVECADAEPVTDRLGEVVAELDGMQDAAVAEDAARREALWKFRELHAEAVNTVGPPLKLDVTVPLGDVGRFVVEVGERLADLVPSARVWMWGHAGDGNVHVNLTDLDPAHEEAGMTAVLDLVLELGGSVSAEHGIGRLKRQWLARQRGDADVAAMRAIKSALDPRGLFQPDLLFPDRA